MICPLSSRILLMTVSADDRNAVKKFNMCFHRFRITMKGLCFNNYFFYISQRFQLLYLDTETSCSHQQQHIATKTNKQTNNVLVHYQG